ncbi:hypothetical protein NFI96_034699, partial [Prochilodus magdalenae]
MSEFWLCFNCCIAEQPQPVSHSALMNSVCAQGSPDVGAAASNPDTHSNHRKQEVIIVSLFFERHIEREREGEEDLGVALFCSEMDKEQIRSVCGVAAMVGRPWLAGCNTALHSLLSDLAGLKRRRRIDRSMIGEPTNFVHTAHVGSGDLFSGMDS